MRRADVNARGSTPDIDVAWIPALLAVADDLPAANGRVAPVPIVSPGDYAALEAGYSAFRAAGAPAAIRLNCKSYPLEPWVLSPIPEFAEREEACLVLDLGDRADADRWAALVHLAREYPRLPVLALGMPLNSPVVGKALDASPNIVLEAYDAPELAEHCARYGSYRFAYGSAGRAVITPLEDGDLEQVGWTTAAQLGDGRWGPTYL